MVSQLQSEERSPADAGRAVSALIWFGVFLVLQVVALAAALALSPAGFDPCGTEGHGPLGLQRAIAVAALVLSAIYAVRRIRGWYGPPAIACLVVAGLVYWILLRDPSSFDCGTQALVVTGH